MKRDWADVPMTDAPKPQRIAQDGRPSSEGLGLHNPALSPTGGQPACVGDDLCQSPWGGIEDRLCVDCGLSPPKAGRRTCGRCTMLREHRDPEHDRERRRDYKRRLRLRLGCKTRDQIASEAVARREARALAKVERGVRPRSPGRQFTTTDTLRKSLEVRARRVVYAALRRGRLVRPFICQRCGALAHLHAHHEDHARPLDVLWLCEPCHYGHDGVHAHTGHLRGDGGCCEPRATSPWRAAARGWVLPGARHAGAGDPDFSLA